MALPTSALASIVLMLHVVVIAFNLFGLAVIPLGAQLGWSFVRVVWWRALHVASLAVVAVQALAGRACFLTILQDDLEGATGEDPLLMRLADQLLYWSLPMSVFTVIYVAALAYVLLLWRVVPPRSSG